MPNSLELARLCAEAYAAVPSITDDDGVARCIIRKVDGYTVLAFAGTNPRNIHDDLCDLDIRTSDIPRIGPVHHGFWFGMIGIAEQCNQAIGNGPAILTGHSLGGAIAIDLALYRTINSLPTWGVVTFGAPHISMGFKAKATLASIPVAMYRHANDPIPEVPLCIPGLYEWQHPAMVTQLGDGDGIPAIHNHDIDQYIAALSNGA